MDVDVPPGRNLEVVDLANPNVTQLLREACIESGFFYLVNHGIEKLIDEVFEQTKRFFDLPLEEKMKLLHDVNHRGYTPFEEENLDPAHSSKGDTKEGFYIGLDAPNGHPRSSWPLHGPNQWPSPELLPGWRETFENFYGQALKLGMKMAGLIALALNLEETYFENSGMFDYPMAVVRLLHYAAEVSNPESGVFGCGAHSDYGLITFLLTDSVPGLQICRQKDAVPRVWEDVTPMKGAFVVNLGDMLERWSNGLFRSTLHRVLANGTERYSVPFFFEPNFDALVECLPTCCSESNPAKYPPVTSGQHLLGKYKATHSGFDAEAKKMNGFEPRVGTDPCAY